MGAILLWFYSVGLEFPRVEVRYEHLKVNALVHVGNRALPTLPNFIFNMSEVGLRATSLTINDCKS